MCVCTHPYLCMQRRNHPSSKPNIMKFSKGVIISTFFLLLLSSYCFAQETITGIVFNENTKEPIVGASVYIPGGIKGTSSGAQGKFKLQAEKKIDSISVSFVGYQTKTLAVNKKSLKIGLHKGETSLNRIIVSANRNSQARVNTPVAISTISPHVMKET